MCWPTGPRSYSPPIQMSDALASNFVGEFETLVAKCILHGRRKVVDVMEHFPQACRHVIEVLAQVYAHEAHCRDEKLSPEPRLLYHQAHSAPLLHDLHRWINEQFDQRRVEPNSALGQGLRYFLKHWSGLTLFLRQAGAPLDNNMVYAASGIDRIMPTPGLCRVTLANWHHCGGSGLLAPSVVGIIKVSPARRATGPSRVLSCTMVSMQVLNTGITHTGSKPSSNLSVVT